MAVHHKKDDNPLVKRGVVINGRHQQMSISFSRSHDWIARKLVCVLGAEIISRKLDTVCSLLSDNSLSLIQISDSLSLSDIKDVCWRLIVIATKYLVIYLATFDTVFFQNRFKMNRGGSRKPRRVPLDNRYPDKSYAELVLQSQQNQQPSRYTRKSATSLIKNTCFVHNVVNRESKTAVVKCMTFKLTNHLLQLKPESLTFGFAFILFVCYLTGYHRLSQPKNLTSTFLMRKLLRVSVSLQILNLFARCRSC